MQNVLSDLFVSVLVGTAVGQRDFNAALRKACSLSLVNSVLYSYSVVSVKTSGSGLKGDLVPALARLADFFKLGDDRAPFISLSDNVGAVFDLHLKPGGKRVDNRRAHAVKSSRHLISAAAEFSSRMEHGENHGDGGHIVFFVDSGGNSAAVVGDPDDVAGENVHLDVCAVSGKSLVYGVVDDFVNKVMKSGARR